MFAGIGEGSQASNSSRKCVCWCLLFAAVASLICLVSIKVRIHRPVADDDWLVAELTKPESPNELLSSLSAVRLWSQQARAGGRKPDQQQILKLSYALRSVLEVYPELTEAWHAAGSLVTSRAMLNGPALEACGKTGRNSSDLILNENGFLSNYANCTIALDDAPQIANSSPPFDMRRPSTHGHARRSMLALKSVHVIYRGGEILPVDRIACMDCTFEFDLRFPPPRRGRSFMQALLVSDDLTNVGVELPGKKESQ